MSQATSEADQSTDQMSGTIAEWDDKRGFGWVETDSWRIFIHAKDFKPGERRPKVGEKVRFKLGVDPKGRPRAKAVV